MPTLNPVADSYINAAAPNTNYGSAAQLYLHNASKYRLLMRFDLSAIPATAIITSAVLSIYVNSHLHHTDLCDPVLVPLTQAWTENGVTWNSPDGSALWTAPGGDYDNGLFAFFAEVLDPADINRAYTADIANLVQAWVSGAIDNKGLLIDQFNIGSDTTFGVLSRESSVNKPTLAITYTDDSTLHVPDTMLPAGLLAVVDSHPFQHPDQDITKTFQDAKLLGGYYYIQPSARPLTDASLTWINTAIANGFVPILDVGLRNDLFGLSYADLFAYFASVATKYPMVTFFNIGTEANNTWYATDDPLRSPSSVTEMVRAAHDGIKSVIPTAIIGLMELGGTTPYDYLKLCVASGLASYTHFWGNGQEYTASKFNSLYTVVQRQITNARFRDYALAQGALVDGRIIAYQEEGMMRTLVDSIVQAKVVCIKTLLNAILGFLNEWYKMYDPVVIGSENFRIALFNADNTTTHFRAFDVLARLNQSLNPRVWFPAPIGSSVSAANILRLGFKKSATEMAVVLWNAAATPTDTLAPGMPVNLTVKDYGLIPTQIVDPLTGVPIKPDYSASGGRVTVLNIPVQDYPLIVLFGPSSAPPPPLPNPQLTYAADQYPPDYMADAYLSDYTSTSIGGC